MNEAKAQAERGIGMEFNMADNEHVVISTDNPSDVTDMLAIVNDYMHRTGEHLKVYSGVSPKDAEDVKAVLEDAITRNLGDIDLNREQFVALSYLITEYRSHGYGTMSKTYEEKPPVEEGRYDEISDAHHTALEALFPVAD